jgi:sodium transport system permease protein
MKRIWIVFKKEIIDNLRDRRSLTSALLTPLFSPIFLVALIILMGKTMFTDPIEQPLILPVAGAEYAPGLIEFLVQNNVQVIAAPDDPALAVREGNEKVVLIIGEDYGKLFLEGKPAPVQIVMDSSRQSSMADIQRTRELVNQYSMTISVLRLQARGINPAVLSTLSVAQMNVATPESQTLIFISILPFMLIITMFVGAMYVVIDTTAGERERASLEPLLVNPVRRGELVLGKLLAALPFGVLSIVLALVFFGLAFNVIPLEEMIGMPLRMDVNDLVTVLWLLLPLLLLATALQMVVATFTRSFKEAQNYLGLLPLVLAAPGALIGFMSVKPGNINMLFPSYSQTLLINQVLRQETVLNSHIIISVVSTLVISILLILLAIHLFKREQVLQGR